VFPKGKTYDMAKYLYLIPHKKIDIMPEMIFQCYYPTIFYSNIRFNESEQPLSSLRISSTYMNKIKVIKSMKVHVKQFYFKAELL